MDILSSLLCLSQDVSRVFMSELGRAGSLSELLECLLSYKEAMASSGPEFQSPRMMLG